MTASIKDLAREAAERAARQKAEERERAKANGHDPEVAPDPGTEPKAEAFAPIDFAELEGKEPPTRRYVVDQWLPTGCVTSLYGEGGIGKSLLAQQLATCAAIGVSGFGFTVQDHGPVVGVFTEDDTDELWRRQVRINKALPPLRMPGLKNLHLQGRVGLENAMLTFPSSRVAQVSPLFDTIRQACVLYRPKLLILDNGAQLYGGDENDRFQVSYFCNLIAGLAREFDLAALLLGHPAKMQGSEYSGSTAWNACVRNRLLLSRDKEGGLLTLARVKSNYAPPDSVQMQWTNGVLRPAAGEHMGEEDREALKDRELEAERTFLDALDTLTSQGRNVSHSPFTPNFAPKVMGKALPDLGFSAGELEAAMNRLFQKDAILANAVVGKTPRRQPIHGIARRKGSGL
jgi:RecA-family ATPase